MEGPAYPERRRRINITKPVDTSFDLSEASPMHTTPITVLIQIALVISYGCSQSTAVLPVGVPAPEPVATVPQSPNNTPAAVYEDPEAWAIAGVVIDAWNARLGYIVPATANMFANVRVEWLAGDDPRYCGDKPPAPPLYNAGCTVNGTLIWAKRAHGGAHYNMAHELLHALQDKVQDKLADLMHQPPTAYNADLHSPVEVWGASAGITCRKAADCENSVMGDIAQRLGAL